MKVLSLTMAFLFAIVVAAAPMHGSSFKELSERQVRKMPLE